SEQDGERVACRAGRSAGLQAAREDQPDPHDLGPPASLRAPLLRSVRWDGGAASRRTTPSRPEAGRAGVHRQVPLARPGAVAAACPCADPVVAGAAAFLRRFEARADMGLLATGAAHLPSPDPGADLAAPRWSACPGDLRAFRRCDLERS